MLEQADEFMDAPPLHRTNFKLSDEVIASLQAVRAAQEAAQARARRETVRTRLWFGAVVGALGVAALVFGPRIWRGSESSSPAASLTDTPPSSSQPSAATPAMPTTTTTATTPGADGQSAAGAPAAIAAPAEIADRTPEPAGTATAADDGACAETFGQRRWRLSVAACTQAFEANPNDARLALRVAHGHHARSHFPEAGEWANRAITLDPKLAEAFVIVAHAEARARRPQAALEAYRRYLALAPRGWHASEARGAIRAHQRQKHARLPSPGHAAAREAAAVRVASGD